MKNTSISISRKSLSPTVLVSCTHAMLLETYWMRWTVGIRECSITLIYTSETSGPLLYWIKILLLKSQKVKHNSRGCRVLSKLKVSTASMSLKQPSDGKNILSLLIWPMWKPLLITTNFLSQQVHLMPGINHTDLQLSAIFVNQEKTEIDRLLKRIVPKLKK